jgi:hypothetical protein
MIRFLRNLVITIAVLVFGVFAYDFLTAHTQRFRLTIEVETPEGIKSASNVIETTFRDSNWGLPQSRGLHVKVRGDAVFLDLGHGHNLVALLGFGENGLDQSKLAQLARFALAPGQRVSWQDSVNLKGAGELPRSHIPTLITFTDINDPKSARLVDPDLMSASFGPGYRFLRATVETTNDRPSQNIDKTLPWWSQPGRPTGAAMYAWLTTRSGPSIDSKTLFRRE